MSRFKCVFVCFYYVVMFFFWWSCCSDLTFSFHHQKNLTSLHSTYLFCFTFFRRKVVRRSTIQLAFATARQVAWSAVRRRRRRCRSQVRRRPRRPRLLLRQIDVDNGSCDNIILFVFVALFRLICKVNSMSLKTMLIYCVTICTQCRANEQQRRRRRFTRHHKDHCAARRSHNARRRWTALEVRLQGDQWWNKPKAKKLKFFL